MEKMTLKSCPFCGGRAELNHDKKAIIDEYFDFWEVGCRGCGISTGIYNYSENAVAVWNMREGNK